MGGALPRSNLVSCVFLLQIMVNTRFSAAAHRSPAPVNIAAASAVQTGFSDQHPSTLAASTGVVRTVVDNSASSSSTRRYSHQASSGLTTRRFSSPTVGMVPPAGAYQARHLQDKSPAYTRRSSTSTPLASASASGPAIRILAYGDSLTAGWHDGGESLTPYAPTLEKRLRQLVGHKDIIVRHRGLSGWTAQSMAQAADHDGIGIRAILRKADALVKSNDADQEVAGVAGVPEEKRHTITACIIIAGTNDLGTSSTPDEIFDHVMELHGIAHAQGIHTISVDIPPSAGTAMGPKQYREVHQSVNKKLHASSLQSNMRIHVACPIQWYPEGRPGAELWEEDGLHMSAPGYESLGMGLAPEVYNALVRWGIVPKP